MRGTVTLGQASLTLERDVTGRSAEYLDVKGSEGVWQTEMARIPVEVVAGEGGRPTIRVGPAVVDAMVALGGTPVRVTLASGEGPDQVGALKIDRELLGSAARDAGRGTRIATASRPAAAAPAAVAPPETPAVEVRNSVSVEPAPEGPSAVQLPMEPEGPAPERRSRWARLAAGVAGVLLLLGAGVWAYFHCLLPGLAPAGCGVAPALAGPAGAGGSPGASVPPVQDAEPPATTGGAGPVEDPGQAPPPPAEKPVRCVNMGAEECLALADATFQAGDLGRARQLYQSAARLGAVAANVKLARMYDPDGWSASASPAAQADWETAAYWYEEAARAKDVGGLLGAGRLLCRFGRSEIERRRALDFLREARERGAGPEAEALAQACGGGAR